MEFKKKRNGKDYSYLVGYRGFMFDVTEYVGYIGNRKKVKCKCDCGKEFFLRVDDVTNRKSCGCYINPEIKKYSLIDGRSKEKLYGVYCTIKSRTTNPNCKEYKYYGARGIKIGSEWSDYAEFRKWAYENGYKDGLTIERIDNNEDYCPRNCRLATMMEQCQNRSNSRLVEFNGQFKTLRVWCNELGLNYKREKDRLYKKYSINDQFKLSAL